MRGNKGKERGISGNHDQQLQRQLRLQLRPNPRVVNVDLHSPPEVIRVKVARELWIDVDDVDVAFCGVADDGFVVCACCGVGFDVDAEGAVEFEFQPVASSLAHVFFCHVLRAFSSRYEEEELTQSHPRSTSAHFHLLRPPLPNPQLHRLVFVDRSVASRPQSQDH